jgi:hypothetical protein
MQQATSIAATESERPTMLVDPSAPFDAHTYYAGLRALNVDPNIHERDGSLWEYSAVGHTVGDVSQLVRWAMAGDPDSSLRREYAFAAWSNRPASDLPIECQCVPLGV